MTVKIDTTTARESAFLLLAAEKNQLIEQLVRERQELTAEIQRLKAELAAVGAKDEKP